MMASSKNLVRMTILPSLRLLLLSTLVLLALLLACSMRSAWPQLYGQRLVEEKLLRKYCQVAQHAGKWIQKEAGR
jgi:hypothetical protein